MRLLRSVLILCSILLAMSASGAPEVVFPAHVEVSQRSGLTWADVVEVRGATEELLGELASVRYNGGGIEEVRAQLRERRAATDIYSRTNTKITLSSQFSVKMSDGYSSAEFRRKLLNRLSATCADCSFEIKSVRDQNLQIGSDWTLDESSIKATSSLLVSISTKKSTLWIPVQIRVLQQAYVAIRAVPFGQKIKTEDFEIRTVDVGNLRDAPATSNDLKDTTAARAFAMGQTVSRADLRREDFVTRGQAIKLSAGDEIIEVIMNATADQAGKLGDVIRVKNIESGRVFSAVVTGRGEARLQ